MSTTDALKALDEAISRLNAAANYGFEEKAILAICLPLKKHQDARTVPHVTDAHKARQDVDAVLSRLDSNSAAARFAAIELRHAWNALIDIMVPDTSIHSIIPERPADPE